VFCARSGLLRSPLSLLVVADDTEPRLGLASRNGQLSFIGVSHELLDVGRHALGELNVNNSYNLSNLAFVQRKVVPRLIKQLSVHLKAPIAKTATHLRALLLVQNTKRKQHTSHTTTT